LWCVRESVVGTGGCSRCVDTCSVASVLHAFAAKNSQYSIASHSTVQCSIAQYSTVQYSAAYRSISQYSTVRYNVEQKRTEQCSTAQHSIVQRSIAQCRTGQYSTARHLALCQIVHRGTGWSHLPLPLSPLCPRPPQPIARTGLEHSTPTNKRCMSPPVRSKPLVREYSSIW
jgi:hypothetical protein